MYLIQEGSVQRSLTSGPKGWPTDQIPWPADQVLCRFGPWLCAHVSTREGESQASGESRWRPNHKANRPRG
jgi:hypothetical protein